MNYLYLLVAIVIIFIVIDKFGGKRSIKNEIIPMNNININENNIGFVKPEHKLLKILNNISSGTKIKLSGICKHYIYNKTTIDSNLYNDLTMFLLISYILKYTLQ